MSNYVQGGSALDKEALKRGTSVYLADRVIPMLPERLSNGICSLNQGQDRLTLSCLMDIDENGTVVAHRIAETVIRVDRRMSYNPVSYTHLLGLETDEDSDSVTPTPTEAPDDSNNSNNSNTDNPDPTTAPSDNNGNSSNNNPSSDDPTNSTIQTCLLYTSHSSV